jgi:hypothetical protein
MTKKYYLPAAKKNSSPQYQKAYDVWSLKDEEELQLLARAGVKVSEIAKKLGRSVSAIRIRLKQF